VEWPTVMCSREIPFLEYSLESWGMILDIISTPADCMEDHTPGWCISVKQPLTIGINPRIISHKVSGGKSLQSHIYTRLEPLRMHLLHGKGDTPITGAPKPM